MTTSISAGFYTTQQNSPAQDQTSSSWSDTLPNDTGPFSWESFLHNLPPHLDYPSTRTNSISDVFQSAVGSAGEEQSAPNSSSLSDRGIKRSEEEFGFEAIPGSPFEDDSSPEVRRYRDRTYSESGMGKVRSPVSFEDIKTGNPSPNSVAGFPEHPAAASKRSSALGKNVRFSPIPEKLLTSRYFFSKAPSNMQSATLKAAKQAYNLYAKEYNASIIARRDAKNNSENSES